MASMYERQKIVLNLYKRSLKSARKCPQWEQKKIMEIYVKSRFRESIQIQDPMQIQKLLKNGEEELSQMEYYHSIYELKQQEQLKRQEKIIKKSFENISISNDIESQIALDSYCPECHQKYIPQTAKFCSNCGRKRNGLTTH